MASRAHLLSAALLAAALSKFFLVEMTRAEQLLCVAGALLMLAVHAAIRSSLTRPSRSRRSSARNS